MTPILYDANEESFTSNGLGRLSDATGCTVTEERNGQYELAMEYPITGIHYGDIAEERIILAVPSDEAEAQPFRIYAVSKPMDGIITVSAHHISYDLKTQVVLPFSADSASQAMMRIKENISGGTRFAFWTDKGTEAAMRQAKPIECRSLLGGVEGSVLDIYGGEYEFDRFAVKLHGNRGADRGAVIRYGKNLMGLKVDTDYGDVVTAIVPFWTKDDVTVVGERTECEKSADFSEQKCVTKDFSQEFDEAPTVEQLREKAAAYMENNQTWLPKVSVDVEFTPLWQTQEYKDIAPLERVRLCDTVTVQYPDLGVDVKIRVNKTVYDVLEERYTSLELGDARTSLAETVVSGAATQKDLGDAKTEFQQALDRASDKWRGGSGGYVVINVDGDGRPNELLIMDKPSISEAVKVWRWNSEGLGYSSTGYDGKYDAVITADGKIVADFVATGELDAALVTIKNFTSNHVKSAGKAALEITDGILTVTAAGGTLEITEAEKSTSDGAAGPVIRVTGSKKESGDTVVGCGKVETNDALADTLAARSKTGISVLNDLDMNSHSILNQSDARLKTNIRDFGGHALDTINAIELKSFDYIRDGRHADIGIIAQQLRQAVPGQVEENQKTGVLSVKTNELIYYLIGAVQELSGRPQTTDWTDPYTDDEKRAFCENLEKEEGHD